MSLINFEILKAKKNLISIVRFDAFLLKQKSTFDKSKIHSFGNKTILISFVGLRPALEASCIVVDISI
jgi:hypothetical protein